MRIKCGVANTNSLHLRSIQVNSYYAVAQIKLPSQHFYKNIEFCGNLLYLKTWNTGFFFAREAKRGSGKRATNLLEFVKDITFQQHI